MNERKQENLQENQPISAELKTIFADNQASFECDFCSFV